jgi:3-dehydroquinate synthase
MVCQSLEAAGYEVSMHDVAATEAEKSLQTVRAIYDSMFLARLERGSPVAAVGGGIVGDVAGFAAATFLRGVPFVQVPTTLLAMVDASIGGKTGVNYRLPGTGQMGKNLVGAYWQPRAVIVDPVALTTLEPRDFRCGLAECVKHALIADADLLDWIEERADAIERRDLDVLSVLIERCARIKTAIVVEDELEEGRRALLNLGHTFAHAMESVTELGLRHGEAVAIGLCAAMGVAVRRGTMTPVELARVGGLLSRLALPSRLPRPCSVDRLMRLMTHDKKVAGGRIRLILPARIGLAVVADDVPEAEIRAAWDPVMPG